MIRRDLYAVKADERDGLTDIAQEPAWCYVFISVSPKAAQNKVNEIRNDRSLGINRLAEMVHPSQATVDAFLAAGNAIHDDCAFGGNRPKS